MLLDERIRARDGYVRRWDAGPRLRCAGNLSKATNNCPLVHQELSEHHASYPALLGCSSQRTWLSTRGNVGRIPIAYRSGHTQVRYRTVLSDSVQDPRVRRE